MLISCPQGRTFNSFFTADNIEYAKRIGNIVYNPYARSMSSEETLKLLVDCDTYISYWGAARLTREMINDAQNLKAVIHLGGNPMPFICAEAWKKGICVLSGEKHYAYSSAEGILSYILAALRDIPTFTYKTKYRNEWKHSWDKSRGLYGKTIGLVNYNPIAEALSELLSSFNVRIIVYDENKIPYAKARKNRIFQMNIKDIFSLSDIVCIHSPNTAGSYHTVGFDELSLAKRGALLVDTSIDGVLDYTALSMSLIRGHISAIINASEREYPKLDASLLYMPNVTFMPHMAGITLDMRAVITRELLRECSEYIEDGKYPEHAVKI